jgi:hypothetical protein
MWNNFLISLAIMGKGMAGIFVVVLIITAVVLCDALVESSEGGADFR